MSTIEDLKATHWHKLQVKSWQSLADAIPSAIQTELEMWAHRVANHPIQSPDCWPSHKYLMPVTSRRYEHKLGVFQPAPKQELTFLVTFDGSCRDAFLKVENYLKSHGLNPQEWSMGASTSVLVLS